MVGPGRDCDSTARGSGRRGVGMTSRLAPILASAVVVALLLAPMASEAGSSIRHEVTRIGDFETMPVPGKRQKYEEYAIGLIEDVANRIWLTSLAGRPLSTLHYKSGCVSNIHALSSIRTQLAALNIAKPTTSILLGHGGSPLWPFRCKPVEVNRVNDSKDFVELLILQQNDFAKFLGNLIDAFRKGFPRSAMLGRVDEKSLLIGYDRIDPLPAGLSGYRRLVGYPYLENSDAGYWREYYQPLAGTGLALGDYKIAEGEASVRLTFKLGLTTREGVK